MTKFVATLLIAAAATVSVPAYAQASGTVVVNGSVAPKCSAVAPINGTIALGELAKDDGTVDRAFSKATGGLSTTFTVRCNGSNPNLSVEARPLVNSAGATAAEGYTNKVHYTAKLAAMSAAGGSTAVSDLSLNNGATTARLGNRLAAVANNVSLTIADGATESSTAILDAGTYSGTVDITITAAI
jgi:hypothetical protein